jgi:hypothetical protein
MTAQSPYDTTKEPSGWAVGWTAFAAVMMIVGGVWWVVAGIVALVNDNFFVVTENYVFKFNVTTWGWIHLLIGILVFIAGLGVFMGATWARVVGVIVSCVAAVLAFTWLPWYPVWAIIFIALSVAVIWALTVHGRDITRV